MMRDNDNPIKYVDVGEEYLLRNLSLVELISTLHELRVEASNTFNNDKHGSHWLLLQHSIKAFKTEIASRYSYHRTIVHSEMLDPFTRLEIRLYDVPELRNTRSRLYLWMRMVNHTDMLAMENGTKPKARVMRMRTSSSSPNISVRIRRIMDMTTPELITMYIRTKKGIESLDNIGKTQSQVKKDSSIYLADMLYISTELAKRGYIISDYSLQWITIWERT